MRRWSDNENYQTIFLIFKKKLFLKDTMSFRLNSLYAIEYYRNVFVSDEQVRRERSVD